MKHIEKWFFGLWKRETDVFFSKRFDHIEIWETTTFFGWKVHEEMKEVYLPDLKTLDQAKLRVIAEVYTELHSVITQLRDGGIVQ
jgi:hypothetical protein